MSVSMMRNDYSRNDVISTRMDISGGDALLMINNNGISTRALQRNYGTIDTNISRNFVSLTSDDTLRNNGTPMRDDTSRISPSHKNITVNHSNIFNLYVANVQSAGNKITTVADYTRKKMVYKTTKH